MRNEMKSARTTFIGKTIWTTGAICLTLVQLPFWLVYFVPSWLRQHPRRTYIQTILQQLMRTFLYHSTIVEVKTRPNLTAGAEKNRFVAISPPEKKLCYGVLEDTHIQPTTVAGTWFPKPYLESEGEQTVILYIHGGAFVAWGGRTAQSGFAGMTLANSMDAAVLSICYRLSSNPNCQFPAALQDTVTAYHYLLTLGIASSQIIIAGDSCGANLAIALLRYIADYQDVLPHPAAALLVSPWVDLASAKNPSNVDNHPSARTDYLTGNFIEWGVRSYVPSSIDAASPYISPLSHPFPTKTPLWVCVGGLEVLYDDGVKFAESMKDLNNNVELHVEPYASHAFLGVGHLTGFTKEAENAVKNAKAWLGRCKH